MKTPWAILLCKFNDDDSEPFPVFFTNVSYYRWCDIIKHG